jgi:CDP-glucose 4,6-dehydratase
MVDTQTSHSSIKPDPNYWAGRKVLVTGHTGFKGSWLTVWLNALGAEVYGYALPPDTKDSLFYAANVSDICRSRFGDIRDAGTISSLIHEIHPDTVFHLAAQPLVQLSYDMPLHTFSTNVMGTANLLEACRGFESIKSVIVVTSDKVYRNTDGGRAFVESDPLGGGDPYSASKAATEHVAEAWTPLLARNKTACVVARAGNVIGGGDWSEYRLIPDIMRSIRSNEALNIRNPKSVRPWQHVIEPLAGYIILAEQNSLSDISAVNFGPSLEDCWPVSNLVQAFVECWGNKLRLKVPIDEGGDLHEAGILILDSLYAKQIMGWSPKLTISDAVKATIDWYKLYLLGTHEEDLRALMIHQINTLGWGS